MAEVIDRTRIKNDLLYWLKCMERSGFMAKKVKLWLK